ncbi:alkaline phosphatase family protein [Sediminicoccus sp. KRV36]|uniref:alkaline phosphatase family protein n=1 Tax=Sediminicoccus sp. KRV36 TaxID=3133721 RepID=UPI00200F7210|nr:alkaline phosphatase family protein [Sediminicoccus rosea]UPY37747.1 alkaline phosphatase family protein [Sediminicoccus rosea]
MRFILIVLDGLRPDMVSPASMPALAALLTRGTRFAEARSVFPSETRVATPSLVTGCRPAAHGMVANTVFDRALAPGRLLRTKDAADFHILSAGAESPLLRPGIGEVLAAAGLGFAVVSAGTPGQTLVASPAARRLGQFRWNAADTDTPDALAVARQLGPTPPASIPNLARTRHAARVLTEYVLPVLRPDVALFWCPEPDISFHYRGLGDAAAALAMTEADQCVVRIVAWRDAQPDAKAIGLIVLSDHGHVTGHRKIALAERMARDGLPAGAGGTAITIAPAGAPGIWLDDPGLASQVADWLARQDWAGPLLANDPTLLPGRTGALAALEAQHPRAADLVLLFAGDEAPDHYGLPGRAPFDAGDVPEGGGMHGGLHRRELATVLAFEGGPFTPGLAMRGMADLTDVAPTILHLLGLGAAGMDGRVLHQAWDPWADAPAEPERIAWPGGFVLEGGRQAGRFYPTALLRA